MCILDIFNFTSIRELIIFSLLFFISIFQEKFLKTIGTKHHLFEFLRVLSTKCSPTIFSSEDVQYLLNELCSSSSVNTQLKAPSIKLLLVRSYIGRHTGTLLLVSLYLSDFVPIDICLVFILGVLLYCSIKFKLFFLEYRRS